MAIELARKQMSPKPWGVTDPMPWCEPETDGAPIGEIRFDHSGAPATPALLQLKVLMTNEPLSIQVHPDDAYAHAVGLPNGKTEAWYILSAAPGSQVAVGLKSHVTAQQLRKAAGDGTIAELVAWQSVAADEILFVPAGTIHAIGAGVVIAEIQQRSDATYRLFDYGRQRELHVDSAVAVANTGPAVTRQHRCRLSEERTLLVANAHFVFERIELPPRSSWTFAAPRETWLLVIAGSAITGSFDVAAGDAIFAQHDRMDVHVSPAGMTALVAYGGGSTIPDLLHRHEMPPSRSWVKASTANDNLGLAP